MVRRIFKSLFFVSAIACFQQKAEAQTCAVNGLTNGINGPFDICGDMSTTKYAAYAMVYTGGTEICYGTLYAIDYYVAQSFMAPSFPVKIYMKTSASSTFSSASTYSSMLSGATLVYSSASQSWSYPASVWQTFTLQTPFNFSSGNLIVITEQDRNAIPACGTAPVFGYGTKANTDQYWFATSSGNLSSTTGTIDKWRAGFRLSDYFVLPVDLVGFSGNRVDNKIKLQWSTITETHNAYFLLEKSTDGENFYEIGTIAGSGNSTVKRDYSFYDESPGRGNNYYRLKQVDINGDFKHSDIAYVNYEVANIWLGNIYPNPATDLVNFDLYSASAGTANVELTDMAGRVVLNEQRAVAEGTQNLNFSMDGYSKGIYSLKVSIAETGHTQISKIIKN